MLRRIAAERWFTASAVIGLWPANSEGDDILVFADEARSAPIAVLHTLRQQLPRREGRANVALADFVAPRASGLADYIGAFAVTAGIGEEAVVERFKRANDDYSAIMAKALADRLAEALAERLHQRVRTEFWGYAPDEALGNSELIAEKYRGIRPAPGYPAQPDHTEKATLFELLDGERQIGVQLTESFAMWPGASVCGLYFSHPDSYYFGVGKIERDQVEDYARRKGWTLEQAEKMAGADPQLRSAGGSAQRRRVTQETKHRSANAPVFLFAAAGLTRAALDGSGVRMLTTSDDSERSEQNGADEHERGAHRQNIELQSEMHASHLHHVLC